ncbi:hypothetical protein D3C81_1618190 [compost metagenome]
MLLPLRMAIVLSLAILQVYGRTILILVRVETALLALRRLSLRPYLNAIQRALSQTNVLISPRMRKAAFIIHALRLIPLLSRAI